MQHLALADFKSRCNSGVFDSRAGPGVNRWAGAILLLCALTLSACGGGGSSPPAETSSNCVIGSATIGDCKI